MELHSLWRREHTHDITLEKLLGMVLVDIDKTLKNSSYVSIHRIMFYTVATAFAAIHLAAWNWDFPSRPQRLYTGPLPPHLVLGLIPSL
jgi:hypothetical protein